MRTIYLATLLVISCLGSNLFSQSPSILISDSVFIEDLTWVEVSDAIAQGKTTIIMSNWG